MTVVLQCPNLAQENLAAFHTNDPLLNNDLIVAFYGSSSTPNASGTTNSRIQIHFFSPAGLQSYPRLAISPGSTHYKAVERLSRAEQGDEVCRGLAFGLSKYFSELPEAAKNAWVDQSLRSSRPSPVRLFSEDHAARLVSHMTRAPNTIELAGAIDTAFATRSVSLVDADVLLPKQAHLDSNEKIPRTHQALNGTATAGYDQYAALLEALGSKSSPHTGNAPQVSSRTTTPSHSATFAKTQKERIRAVMCELLDTEERYVSRLRELAECVAAIFEEQSLPASKSVVSDESISLETLLPIVEVLLQANAAFLDSLHDVVENTETGAIEDIESTPEDPNFWGLPLESSREDVTGVALVGECILTGLKQFGTEYKAYIASHARLNRVIKQRLDDLSSDFTKRVHDVGEQRLMSLLIEPVQRLPRYKLYLSTIVKNLPQGHSALPVLHEAEETIAAICLEEPGISVTSSLARFLQTIPSWPQDMLPLEGFVTALDIVELQPPYKLEQVEAKSRTLILILFSEHLVILRKSAHFAISAARLASELDNLTSPTGNRVKSPQARLDGLIFESCTPLAFVECSESHSGKILVLSPISRKVSGHPEEANSKSAAKWLSVRVFQLQTQNIGAASSITEVIVRAGVNGRLKRAISDNTMHLLRSRPRGEAKLGFLFTVLASSTYAPQKPMSSASIRIVIDPQSSTRESSSSAENTELEISVLPEGDGFYKLESRAVNQRTIIDRVKLQILLPVLCKRVESVLQTRYQMRTPAAAMHLLRFNQTVLQSLNLGSSEFPLQSPRAPLFRNPSPVKVLSGLFSGSPTKELSVQFKALPAAPALSTLPPLPHTIPALKAVSEPDFAKPLHKEASNVKLVASDANDLSLSQEELETSLHNYLLALRARCGNLVGRHVVSRSTADPRLVDELSMALIGMKPNFELAAQMPVNVLFASFEKFLNVTWGHKFGALIHADLLSKIRYKSETLSRPKFSQYLDEAFSETAPQNRRAFQAILVLLAELLEHIGNDADRGVLTAAMCEILIPSQSSYTFISLFDRLVDEWGSVSVTAQEGLENESGSISRKDSACSGANTGSVGSKSSSLSRRLGLGSLRRHNSKPDSNSRVQAVLRQMSKGVSPTETMPKRSSSEAETLSSDAQTANGVPQELQKPGIVSHVSANLEPDSQSAEPMLAQLDFGSPFTSTLLAKKPSKSRKKRRSSLSDIMTPRPAVSSISWRTPTGRISEHPPRLSSPAQVSPLSRNTRSMLVSASPDTSVFSPQTMSMASTKENVPPVRTSQTLRAAEKPTTAVPRMLNGSPGLDRFGDPSKPRQFSLTMQLEKSRLPERSLPADTSPPQLSPTKNIERRKSPSTSPRNLGTRLDAHAKVIDSAETSLSRDLGDLRARLPDSDENVLQCITNRVSFAQSPRDDGNIANLRMRLTSLEGKAQHVLDNIRIQTETLESDTLSALQRSERKCCKLETMLNKNNEEHARMQEKHNAELAYLLDQIKQGAGLEELKRKLAELV